MHEMGVLIQLIQQVENIAQENSVSHISSVCVDVGQMSGILPFFLNKYYPLLTEQHPLLSDSRLEIHTTPAEGICTDCQFLFNIAEKKGCCPRCGGKNHRIIRGQDFVLKHITC